MDPSDFPNPYNTDDDMPMFGGGGSGARWPGHEDYRVETPGSVGSAYGSEAEFDPFFTTDAYRVEEMEPSCGQPSAPQPTPTPQRRKKRMARKEKEPAIPLPSDAPNEEYATGRTDYTPEEYMKVAKCWVDITEDSVNGNHQTSARMWDRIERRYNEVKPAWAYKRTKEQLRKCWDRIKNHLNNFRDIYTKNRDDRGSGESLEDVLQKSLSAYHAQYGQFKFHDIWLMLKDKPKFDGGIPLGPKRTKNTASGGYTSSGGPSPVDLNAEPEGSSGTPTSTFRRPVGNKTAKAQAKGKAAASGSTPSTGEATAFVSSALSDFDNFRESYDYRLLIDATAARDSAADPSTRRMYEQVVERMKEKLGVE